jgi:hypothetical protein
MDWSTWIATGLSAIVLPTGSWLVGKTIANDKRITAHEEVDKVRFDNIDKNLDEVKGDVKTVDSKLDRLIERFL